MSDNERIVVTEKELAKDMLLLHDKLSTYYFTLKAEHFKDMHPGMLLVNDSKQNLFVRSYYEMFDLLLCWARFFQCISIEKKQ